MTAYVHWVPGPTITEEYSSFLDLYAQFVDELVAEVTGDFSGDATSATWYPVSVASTLGAEPYWTINYTSTAGGHTCAVRIRYSATLYGTLDPAIPLAVDLSFPHSFIGVISYSALALLHSRATANAILAIIGSGFRALLTALTASTALVENVVTILYTDGARTNGAAGYRLVWTYNPSTAEIAAGVKQLVASRVVGVSDADDGTLNLAWADAELGQAQSQVPVLVTTPGASADAWNAYLEAVKTAPDQVGPFGSQTVTHFDDLGTDEQPNVEPVGGEITELYRTASMLPALINTPALWPGLTAGPGGVVALVATAGVVLSGVVAAGIIGSAAAALAYFVGSFATAVSTIVTHLSTVAGGTTSLVTTGGGIKTALELVTSNSASNHIYLELRDLRSATDNLANSVQAIESSVSGQQTSQASIATSLEAIATALVGDPMADPVLGNITQEVARMADRSAEVAETRNLLRVRVKGVTVDATNGVSLDGEEG